MQLPATHRLFNNREFLRSLLILDLSAQLERKTVWIVNVETVLGRFRILPAALNLGLHSFPDSFIVVPVGDRETQVIDDRRGGGFSGMKN
jgi:hypothetical protein